MKHIKTSITITLTSETPDEMNRALTRLGDEFPLAQVQLRIDVESEEEAAWVRERIDTEIDVLDSSIEAAVTFNEKRKRDRMLEPPNPTPMDTLWETLPNNEGHGRTIRVIPEEEAE
jgi:hypothetical protein